MKLAVALLALLVAFCSAEADPLKDAILLKGADELKVICQKAGIQHEEDASLETLQALVYEFAQNEKPEGVPRKHWDGSPMAAAAPKASPAPKAKAKPAATGSTDGISSMLFKSLDVDKDGTLSRAEMESMIEKANAAAKLAGETVPADFFGSLDSNQDGRVDRAEADEFFTKMAAQATGATPAAAKPSAEADMSEQLFKAMDKDGDGVLSRAEMAALIEKANEANKAQGIPEVDFFDSIDWNHDGVLSREESKEWFSTMAKELSKPEGKKDEL